MEAQQTPIIVTVRVDRGNWLQGRKSTFQSFVKVEVDGVVLGESQKTQKDLSEHSFHYDFSCSFQCFRDALAIAELARKLVIVTVWDFLPEEKKADARSAVLGQAVVDLLPFLHGQTKFSARVPLHSGTPLQTKGHDSKSLFNASVDVLVEVSEALVSSDALARCNLLKVTMETAFSVPESWTLPCGSSPMSSSYTAALELPVSSEDVRTRNLTETIKQLNLELYRDRCDGKKMYHDAFIQPLGHQKKNQLLVFSDGVLKAGGVREEKGRPKKRPFLPQLLPANTVLPGASVEPGPVQQEDGELTGQEDRLFREEAEVKKNHVSWDVEMSCFLDRDATNRLRDNITKCRLWPVEIMRSMVNAKTELPEESPEIPFHGVAFVDMGPLLFPGATRIRGAYCIQPFTEKLLFDKVKRRVSVLKEYAKVAAAAARSSSAMSGGKRGAGSKGAARKPTPNKVDTADGTEMGTMLETVSEQGNVYLEARTYILIEISLEKPLVPKTPPEELSRRVMSLIPPKPPRSPGPTKAEKAVQNYAQQVASVVQHVSEQVDKLFGAHRDLSDVNREELRAQVISELILSGIYFTLKQQLKPAIVKIVQDKMEQTEPVTNVRGQLEFVSWLYTFLVDEMHVTLNKIFSDEEEDSAEGCHLSQSQLRYFAEEAQSIGEYEQALQYYLELLVQNPNDPLNMFNLGRHYMVTADYMKAKKYFSEAVATDQAHQPSLIMCGVLAIMFERYTDSKTFLEQAATMDNHGVVAWTLLGLLHQSHEDQILSERAFLEANKLLKSKEPKKLRATVKHRSETVMEKTTKETQEEVTEATSPQPQPPEEQEQAGETSQSTESEEDHPGSSHGANSSEPKVHRDVHRPSIYTETVSFLLQNSALQMAERVLALELLSPEGGLTMSYLLHLARLQLCRRDHPSALANLEEALSHNDENTEAWALKGHCHLLQGDLCRAQESYGCSLSFQPPPADLHLVLLRLGSICQQREQFDQAKLLHLQACERSPSCLTWLGLGVACYRLGELSLAESALTEANHLNNQNAQVWIYLAFICLKSGRLTEAEQLHKYAVQFNLQDEELLREYRDMHEQARFSFLSHCFQG